LLSPHQPAIRDSLSTYPYRPLPNPEALQADLVTHTEAQRRADEAGDEAVARDAGAKAERSRRWLRRIAELPQGAGCPYGFSVLEMSAAIWITYSAEPYSTLASEPRVQFSSKVIVINPVAGDSQFAYLLPKDRHGIGLYQEEPSSGCRLPGSLDRRHDKGDREPYRPATEPMSRR